MELSAIATFISVALALATFFIGRISASHLAGKETGSLAADIRYIKESILRIEGRVDCDIGKLEDRADEVRVQITALGKDVSRSMEASRSAHRRLDGHLAREHGPLMQ